MTNQDMHQILPYILLVLFWVSSKVFFQKGVELSTLGKKLEDKDLSSQRRKVVLLDMFLAAKNLFINETIFLVLAVTVIYLEETSTPPDIIDSKDTSFMKSPWISWIAIGCYVLVWLYTLVQFLYQYRQKNRA